MVKVTFRHGVHRVTVPALASILLGAVLVGCTSDRGASPAPEPMRAASASPTVEITPAAPTDRMSPPATRSGPLSGQDMPRPSALGHGWDFRVDEGSLEDGYAGNGTPTVERDPGEVSGLAVPLGCVDRGHLPRPRWALESDYAHGPTGTIGLVIRLRFTAASDAATFMQRRDAALAACAAQTSTTGTNGNGLVQQLRLTADSTVSTRSDTGDLHDGSAWTEIVALGTPDTDVTLVAVNVPQSAPVAHRAIVRLSSAR